MGVTAPCLDVRALKIQCGKLRRKTGERPRVVVKDI